jgi:hypothetical protein
MENLWLSTENALPYLLLLSINTDLYKTTKTKTGCNAFHKKVDKPVDYF